MSKADKDPLGDEHRFLWLPGDAVAGIVIFIALATVLYMVI